MSKYSLMLVAGMLFAVNAAAAQTGEQGASPTLPGDRDASAALAKIVDATRSKGLPVDPILAKVRYALVVHASPARIVATARAMAGRLEVAREALAPHPSANDIAAGEAALNYVPRTCVRMVRAASPKDSSVAVPLGVLTQLVSNGISAKRAADFVTSLIKRGATGQLLASLSNDVNSDVQRGIRPNDALDVRMRGLTAALAPAGAAAAVADAPGISLTAGNHPPGKPRP